MTTRDPHLEWIYQSPETDEPVIFLLDGDGEAEIAGGPIVEAGYYVLPECTPMCCRPHGPFATMPEARDWSRTRRASS